MSALSIEVPFPVFQDKDGQPLDSGYVWIGVADLNPQTNPVSVYFDSALTVPATQPLRTLNGYISSTGSPAQVYIDGNNFSILVQDSKGSMIYNFPQGTGIEPIPNNASGIVYDPAGTGAVPTTVQTKLRETVSVKDFGAVGDGVTNDTDAFVAATNYINSQGGGTLEIPYGTYVVGQQLATSPYTKTDPLNFLNCTLPVVVRGNGSKLMPPTGMKYGVVDGVTCDAIQLIHPVSCSSIVISDLELDGRVSTVVVGTGVFQRQGDGIVALLCDSVTVSNVYSHHHCRDGIMIGTAVDSSTTTIYPVSITNSRFEYNGRQGFSFIGGNNLTVTNCYFGHTGKNGFVSMAPGAGVDIESEYGLIRNAVFSNCKVFDNAGAGLVADSGDSADCTFYDCDFIGTTTWSCWTKKPGFKYYGCNFIGAAVNMSVDYVSSFGTPTAFYSCGFHMNPSLSPSGVIYGVRMSFDTSPYMEFYNCEFTAVDGYALPFASSEYYTNCVFTQTGTPYSIGYLNGSFFARNDITTTGTLSGVTSYGFTYINTVLQQAAFPVATYNGLGLTNNTSAVQRIVASSSATGWATSVGGANVGDIVIDYSPTAGGFIGSVCVAAGTPGTWKTFGAISA